MQRDVIYPDVTHEQWLSVLRSGQLDIPQTEIYRSGGAKIDQNTGNILVHKPAVLTQAEAVSSGQYPHLFRGEEFWEPEVVRDVPDSVVSAPQSRLEGNNEIFNPFEDMHDPQDLSVYARYKFRPFDEKLAAFKHREEILRRIDTYPIVVIEGETGCGKSTQIPQYVLHNAASRGQFCNIIVTQPRRIAAISVARQVNNSNNWPTNIPGICSYQIGLEMDKRSKDTRLLYCTTGVVLRKLMAALKLRDRPSTGAHFTHIILDEVHERDREMDLLMLLVKKYRAHFPTVKVVIMSATVQTQKTAEYFSIPAPNRQTIPAPVVRIPGRQFAVAEFYLDDLCDNRHMPGLRRPRLSVDDPQLSQEAVEVCVRTVENFSVMEAGGQMGAVLVFLPGMQEIRIVRIAMEKLKNVEIIMLHSEIGIEEQRRAFLTASAGKRKVILSTNIAESSITVPDVTYVIDFCLNKILFAEHTISHLECLRTCWASKANCRQRAGRAGRVADGRCYRLIERRMYDTLNEFPQPEMLRASLCQTILQVKLLDMGPPRSVLANAIDPPEENSIFKAVLLCKEVWALTTPPLSIDDRSSSDDLMRTSEALAYDGELTFLGEIVANLPVDVRLGKLILIGHMLGVTEACVIIAASLTVKSFFVKRFSQEFDYHRNKMVYGRRCRSDPLAYLSAYNAINAMPPSSLYNSQERYGINRTRFEDARLLVEDLKARLVRFGLDLRDWTENLPSEKRQLRENNETELIRFALAAAFYPNYFISSKTGDEELIRRELSGRNHLTSVLISNLPQYIGFFYHPDVVKMFQRCVIDPKRQRIRVFYEQSKAYLEFIDNDRPDDDFSDCVYLAIRMGKLQRETMYSIRAYNSALLQEERERLMSEARESFRRRGRLLPTLIMITDDAVRQAPSRSAYGDQRVMDDKPTASLLAASALSNYAMPGEIQRCAKIEITHVVSGCEFYARFIPVNDGAPDSEMNILQRILERAELKPAQIANLDFENLYVSFLHDFKYQRVKILHFLPELEKATVLFVDVGVKMDISISVIFECPPEIADLKYRAVHCKLAKVREVPRIDIAEQAREKLLRNQFETTDSGERRLKQFDIEIFSIVNGTVHLVLMARRPSSNYASDCASFSVNQWLIDKKLAEFSSETAESVADHKARSGMWGLAADREEQIAKEENSDYWPLSYSNIRIPNEPSFDSPINLRISKQPAELTWSGCWYGDTSRIRVSTDSLNSIALDRFPASRSPYLLTAASVAKDDRSGGLSLSDTTLYPPKPGMPAIIAMVCSPAAELIKGSRQRTHPIGVLCGLGPDASAERSTFQEHDFYMTFDAKLTEDDLVLVNTIREDVNCMIDRSNPVITQNAVQFRRLQQRMIEAVVKLTTIDREYVEPEYPASRSSFLDWCLKETTQQPAKNVLKMVSSKMHSGHRGSGDVISLGQSALPGYAADANHASEQSSYADLERNLQQLRQLAEGEPMEFQSVICLLCNMPISNLRTLRVHLAASNHKSREGILLSRKAAEVSHSSQNQLRPRQAPTQPAPPRQSSSSAPYVQSAGRGRGFVFSMQLPQQQQFDSEEPFDWSY